MPTFLAEYFFTETQTEEIEAETAEQAEKLMLETLHNDFVTLGRPTDIYYGVRSCEEVEPEEQAVGENWEKGD